ncbi:MAG: Rieske 2Fe-2S domain-containing protein [Aquabacterium sp.]
MDHAAAAYLHDAWYVAALSPEVTRVPRAVTLLGQDVVLYRQLDGTPVALEDACPHRKLPLSMGRLKGDAIECGYHGLTFDPAGRCIDAATQPRIPPRACVRAYPSADRHGLLWVWMGDAARADPGSILDIPHRDDPGWHLTAGDQMTVACHYLLVVDNLLDPSHVAWVHRGSFAGAGTDATPLEVDVQPDRVVANRWLRGQMPPPFYAPLVKFEGPADRLQHYEVRYPSLAINMSIYTPAGRGGPGLVDDAQTYRMVSYNFLTPIDEHRTLYVWLQHRNTDPHDAAITRRNADGARAAFEEDRVILEAVHRGLRRSTTPTTGLMLDVAAQRFRAELARRIAAQAPAAAP